jgi:hypothetical protein
MMRNKISLGVLFVLMTLTVIVAALYRASSDNAYASAALLVFEAVLATFILYGLLFCLAYPFGRLDKYIVQRSESVQSPFATDRLPSQVLMPVDREGE